MTKIKNLAYLLVFTAILLALKFYVIDAVFDAPKDADIWFASGLLLIILGIFVTEKYFTKPLDVIVNVVTLGIVLFTLDDPASFRLWNVLLGYLGGIGALAMISFVLYDHEQDPGSLRQQIAKSGSTIACFLGSSRVLFSTVFILSLFNYFIFSLESAQGITKQQVAILLTIIFWAAMLLVEPIDKKLIQPLIDTLKAGNDKRVIGKVHKRMSPRIVVVEQLNGAPILKSGDLAVLDDMQRTRKAGEQCVLTYLYSQDTGSQRLSFFYSLAAEVDKIENRSHVHGLSSEEAQALGAKFGTSEVVKNSMNLLGFVHSNSDIDILKIKMIEGVDDKKKIKEGDLVSVSLYDNPTKYQIINVETVFDSVDGESRQGGKIITAQQIGFWLQKPQKFENTGWVPEINSPVFLEGEQEKIPHLGSTNFRVGVVPKSTYPIYVDLEESVTHHIAVIGKTGTGKSRMAGKIIDSMAECGYKVVILEVDRTHKQSLTNYVRADYVETQKADVFDLSTAKKPVISVDLPLDKKDKEGGPVNLSDLAAEVIEKVIKYQMQNEDQKICVALEEAYDFIPENSFGRQDFGQPKVSRISQMVLKCRKHNIGFLVITQRTALVSKTILYQCHTIIALQSVDETSKTFLGAYVNQQYLDSMSILPRYRAIVVGKGSSCDKPVIVDFFDKSAAEKPGVTTEAAATEEEEAGI